MWIETRLGSRQRRTARQPIALVIALAVVMLSACAAAPTQRDHAGARSMPTDGVAQVHYHVSVLQPQTQTVQVTMRVTDWPGDALVVAMPVWRPGKYRVLDQAGAIRRIGAADRDGASLPIGKLSKSQWRIDTNGPGDVMVRYELFADALRDRTVHVDDTHAFLSGESVFLYVQELVDQPAFVRIDAPPDWRVSTGLSPADGQPEQTARTFIAGSYHELIDCPFEIGTHDHIAFEVDRVPYAIVIWGDAMYDPSVLAADCAAIVREQVAIFGSVPFDRFVFQVHCAEGLGGGTEHRNSTIMQTTPGRLEGAAGRDDAYKLFLGLVSHEMFHAWNVKSFIPAGLVPYDYQRENYTAQLWLVEGTTSYYDDLTMARAGLLSEQEYSKRIAGAYATFAERPGRVLQSLAESSFDAWIKYTQPTADAVNTTVSFYRKGSLVSLMLDMAIRQRTSGTASLDSVMRRLYEQFPRDSSGYTEDDVLAIIEDVAGSDFDTFFMRFVHGTDELMLNEALSVVGLELSREEDADSEQPYLGLQLRGDTVAAVLTDGPANSTGIVVGDVLVAIDGRRFRGSLDGTLQRRQPGETIEVTFFRRDRLRTVSVTLASRTSGEWTVRRVAEPTSQQRAMYEAWMHRPWDAPDEVPGTSITETTP